MLLQRSTAGPLQGRVESTVEVPVNTPQTFSIVLVALVDDRLLLLLEAAVVAAAGAWLLTRPELRVGAPH